jgi:hypothetical protein
VFIFRKVVQAAPGLFVVFDELYANGAHEYTQYFHFNNRGEARIERSSAVYVGKKARADLIPLTAGVEMKMTDAPLSRVYNELEQGKCLTLNHKKEGFACLITVIAAAGISSYKGVSAELIPVKLTRTGETLPDDKAHAVRITRGLDSHAVICLHGEVISEVGLIEAGGFKGYGKLMVFSDVDGDGLCLAW